MAEFIIGLNRWTGELLSYRTVENAELECNMWKYIDADSANQAKDIFEELYSEGDLDD